MRSTSICIVTAGLLAFSCSDPSGPDSLALGTYSAQFSGDVEEQVSGVARFRHDLGIRADGLTVRGDILELNVAPPAATLSIQLAILFIDDTRAAEGRFELSGLSDDGLPDQGGVATFQIETPEGQVGTLVSTSGIVTIERREELEVRGTMEFTARAVGEGQPFESVSVSAAFRARISG